MKYDDPLYERDLRGLNDLRNNGSVHLKSRIYPKRLFKRAKEQEFATVMRATAGAFVVRWNDSDKTKTYPTADDLLKDWMVD